MEPDRYQQSHAVFITGIICLILSMGLFGLSFYMLPNVLFNLHYSMPEALVSFYGYVLSTYQVSDRAARGIVFFVLLILASIAALIAHIASNYIDDKIHKLDAVKAEKWSVKTQKMKDSGRVFLRIALVVGFVFLISLLFQWVISSPTAETV